MAIQSLEIAFYNGRIHDKGPGYTYTGHGEFSYNKDAVWSFVAPANRLKKLTVPFTWNNSAAGTGFKLAVDMYFSITSNGSTNSSDMSKPRLAANNDPDREQQITVPMDGSSGSVTAEFTDLHLEAGTTYYIRANVADGIYSSIKGFSQTIEGATYEKQGGAYVDYYGVKKDAVVYFNVHGVWRESETRSNINGAWKETEPTLYVNDEIDDGGEVTPDPISVASYDDAGNVTLTTTYKVTYDDAGNVTLS